jgi:hypothetical protein
MQYIPKTCLTFNYLLQKNMIKLLEIKCVV